MTGANINFAPGRKINIGTGTGLETATVESVGTGGATGTGITLTAPLAIAHAQAQTVSNAAFMCVPPECLPVGQRYTARQPGDPLNQMTYKDGVIVDGISAAGGSRWEDWSNLAMDPTDDCTFWYYGGYGDASRTGGPFFGRTGAFRVPTCRLDPTPAPDASITGHYEGPVMTLHQLRPDRRRVELHRRHRLGRRNALARHRHRLRRHVLGRRHARLRGEGPLHGQDLDHRPRRQHRRGDVRAREPLHHRAGHRRRHRARRRSR